MSKIRHGGPAALALALASLAAVCAGRAAAAPPSVRDALTFHATFDAGPDADFAKGDRAVYNAPQNKRDDPEPGLPANVTVAKGEGRHGGDALRFAGKGDRATFFKVEKNLPYDKADWGGTVSFWVNIDPDADLAPGYCDPVQITERAWNDAALWVDFSADDRPRHFRLGAFADLKVWNPRGADFEKMTPAERPMFDAGKPPFARGKWSHVVITFERFNTGKPDGKATLYLDGEPAGSVEGRTQTYTWEPSKAAVMLGLGYVGLFDDLALFDRALTPAEVAGLHAEGL